MAISAQIHVSCGWDCMKWDLFLINHILDVESAIEKYR